MIIDLENIICESCKTCAKSNFSEKYYYNSCNCVSIRYYVIGQSFYIDIDEDRASIYLDQYNSNSFAFKYKSFPLNKSIKEFESLSELYYTITKTIKNLIFL